MADTVDARPLGRCTPPTARASSKVVPTTFIFFYFLGPSIGRFKPIQAHSNASNMTEVLERGREAVGLLVKAEGAAHPTCPYPSVAAVTAALAGVGVTPVSCPGRILWRLGFEIVESDGVVRPLALRSTNTEGSRPRLEVLRGVSLLVKASPDPYRFAATLRLLMTSPQAPRLKGGYARMVWNECKASGLELLFRASKGRAGIRLAVLSLLGRTLDGWNRPPFPRACSVCGGRSSRVIDLGGPICSDLAPLGAGRENPCYLASMKRPSDDLGLEPIDMLAFAGI